MKLRLASPRRAKLTLGQLTGSSLSLMAACLTQEAHRPVLLVTADTPSALRLEQELQYLLADTGCPVLLFPDWETLPYDTFSPSGHHLPAARDPLQAAADEQRRADRAHLHPDAAHGARVYLDKYSLMVKSGQRLNLQ